MNKIEFRQWMGEKFHYWGFMPDGSFIGPASNNDGDGIPPSEQFTSFLDRKGRKIYEGDICDYFPTGNSADGTPWKQVIGDVKTLIVFKEGRFTLDTYGLRGTFPRHWEVIGNLHQNPDLLS